LGGGPSRWPCGVAWVWRAIPYVGRALVALWGGWILTMSFLCGKWCEPLTCVGWCRWPHPGGFGCLMSLLSHCMHAGSLSSLVSQLSRLSHCMRAAFVESLSSRLSHCMRVWEVRTSALRRLRRWSPPGGVAASCCWSLSLLCPRVVWTTSHIWWYRVVVLVEVPVPIGSLVVAVRRSHHAAPGSVSGAPGVGVGSGSASS
jgi:hypothetical protein